MKLEIIEKFSINTQISHLTKILPVNNWNSPAERHVVLLCIPFARGLDRVP